MPKRNAASATNLDHQNTLDETQLRAQRERAAEDARIEMEKLAKKIDELIVAQPPKELLGYIWAQFLVEVIRNQNPNRGGALNSDRIGRYQFALEYLHAVWSCNLGPYGAEKLNEEGAKTLLSILDEMKVLTMHYSMASSLVSSNSAFGEKSADVEFQAKSSWVLIRGNRHQVLEEEFFNYVLGPHDDALKLAYGAGSADIAIGIQAATNAFRAGHANAAGMLFEQFDQTAAVAKREGISLKEATDKVVNNDAKKSAEVGSALTDLFFGGHCNLSKQTKLPLKLLEDMAYEPGQEKEFFKNGPLAGTPFRTLPARIRPLIKLDNDYYATDGQFVRDSAYRAIQRGLLARSPEYKEKWNNKQKVCSETAFPTILSKQLSGAEIYRDVYYKDVATGQWVETDLVATIDDNLIVVEAKAGVMAMQSPALDFVRYVRAIQDLVVKAHKQCRRFFDYLASADEVPIFALRDGQHVEVAKIQLSKYKQAFPIGLTVESFTPFSSMCKTLPGMEPILGRFPFVSMAIDDLFVLNRFLPTTGSLLHYLHVRQQVAGIPEAMMFDEQDHLGAYITKNRFDLTMREQLTNADMITWDRFSDPIDEAFQRDDWDTAPFPQQEISRELSEVLKAMDAQRQTGWLELDRLFRDLDQRTRDEIAEMIKVQLPNVQERGARQFLANGDLLLHIFLHRSDFSIAQEEISHAGEVACLIAVKPMARVVSIGYDQTGHACSVTWQEIPSPKAIRKDYETLVAEANTKRIKYEQQSRRSPPVRPSKRARRRNRHKIK